MDYKVLALKYRPQTFTEVAGQQPTLLALQHSLNHQQLHNAYLFTGTRGVGKTTLARILAKAINCVKGISATPCGSCAMCISITQGNNIDVLEVDAASRTKVEDTRELLENVSYVPVQARCKIYIIDEVHMLSNHSFNALLKTLEEPPAHVKFILATTDPQKLPVTVLSRCLQFHLRDFTVEQITQHIAGILHKEQIPYDLAALPIIAQCANGSMRDALSLLEQIIAAGQLHVTVVAAQQVLGTEMQAQIVELLHNIVHNNASQAIKIVRELAANNVDFNQALQVLQKFIHKLALWQIVPSEVIVTLEEQGLEKLVASVSALDLQLYYQATLLAVRDIPYALDLASGFEMLVLRMLAFQPVNIGIATTVAPVVSVAPTVSARAAPAAPVVNIVPVAPVLKNSSEVAISTDWEQVISRLNLQGLTKVLAENCVVASWQADAVVLKLQEGQKPLLNNKHIERLQAALQEYLQRKITLNIEIGTIDSETPASRGQRLRSESQINAEQAIRQDKYVQQFTQEFAAKITDIQIQGRITGE